MNLNNDGLEERVVIAGIEDIESMVLLNDKIYPKEWHVFSSLYQVNYG